MIAISLLLAALNAPTELTPIDAAPKHGFPITASATGSWFDIERAGEGWIVEILDDDRALVAWFTYPPADSSDQQAWLLGVGTTEDDLIIIEQMDQFSGPQFGPDYDSDSLISSAWGSFQLAFENCTLGELAYAGPASFGKDARTVDRLTAIIDLPCVDEAKEREKGSRPLPTGVTGAWFDESQVGAGLFLEELVDGRVNAYWFTYDMMGRPMWMTGVGVRSGSEIVFDQLFRPFGTQFGDGFSADEITLESWGSMTLTITDCISIALNYQSAVFGSGSLDLTRLTEPDRVACSAPIALAAGSWQEVAPPITLRTEVSVGVLNDVAYVSGGFGGPTLMESYSVRENIWRSHAPMPIGRNHHMSVGYQGEVFVFGGFIDDSLIRNTRSAFAYDPQADQWRELMPIPASHTAGNLAVELDGLIYLAGGVQRFVHVYDPATDGWEQIRAPGAIVRDHSSAVLLDGEIWVLGGRSLTQGTFHSVAIFDPETRTWRDGPDMLTGHSGFAASVVQGQIMVVGGENISGSNASNPNTIDFFEIFVPAENRWRRGPDLPILLHGSAGAELDHGFFVAGGSPIPASTVPATEYYIYRPAPLPRK